MGPSSLPGYCSGPPRPPVCLAPRRAVIYLNIQVVKGQRRVMYLLKEQISNVSAPPRPGATSWLAQHPQLPGATC